MTGRTSTLVAHLLTRIDLGQSSPGDATHGVTGSLTAALDDLEADTTLAVAVGQGLVDNHVFLKRAEVAGTAALERDALRDRHIWDI